MLWAVFSSDDSTAYILNCGAECGGTAASITLLDMNSNLPGPTIPIDSGTTGLLSGNLLYVAGTKPGANTCAGSSPATLANTCGEVSTVDLGLMTVTATATITDGYHNHIEMGANNRLFIGARQRDQFADQRVARLILLKGADRRRHALLRAFVVVLDPDPVEVAGPRQP